MQVCWKYGFIPSFNSIQCGKGHICLHHISAILSRSTYPRTLWLYSKFKFCNCRTPKIGLVSEKFSYHTMQLTTFFEIDCCNEYSVYNVDLNCMYKFLFNVLVQILCNMFWLEGLNILSKKFNLAKVLPTFTSEGETWDTLNTWRGEKQIKFNKKNPRNFDTACCCFESELLYTHLRWRSTSKSNSVSPSFRPFVPKINILLFGFPFPPK